MPSSSRRYRICVVGALWPPPDGPRDSARVTEVFDFWIFLGGFCRPRHWHSLPITWFDQVIKSVLKWCGCLLSSLPCSAGCILVILQEGAFGSTPHQPRQPGGPGQTVGSRTSVPSGVGRAQGLRAVSRLVERDCPGPQDPKMGQGYQAADLAGELLPCGWN